MGEGGRVEMYDELQKCGTNVGGRINRSEMVRTREMSGQEPEDSEDKNARIKQYGSQSGGVGRDKILWGTIGDLNQPSFWSYPNLNPTDKPLHLCISCLCLHTHTHNLSRSFRPLLQSHFLRH